MIAANRTAISLTTALAIAGCKAAGAPAATGDAAADDAGPAVSAAASPSTSVDSPPTALGPPTSFRCDKLAPAMRVNYSPGPRAAGLGSIDSAAPPSPRAPTDEERRAFLRPMLTTLTTEPASAREVVARALEARASDHVPAPAPAYLDCHGATVVHRVERARVRFVVGENGKIDTVDITSVPDVDTDASRATFALRCLAATPCAAVPIKDVPAGTVVTYAYDRATSGIDRHAAAPLEQSEQSAGFRLGDAQDAGALVRPGPVSVNGRLPVDVVQRILRSRTRQLRECYESALAKNPKLQGTFTTRFVVGTDGSVVTAQESAPELGDASVSACLIGLVRKLTFPKPESGVVTVVFTLTFTPPSR